MNKSPEMKILSYVVMLAVVTLAQAADVRTAAATEQVHIVVGPQAPPIQIYAAKEMASQFERVFLDVAAMVVTTAPEGAKHVVLIGSPETNPAVVEALGADWPDVSDQGLVIRSLPTGKAETLIVGGGSPTSTLWAAYELGHRLGIRYLLRRDTFPNEQRKLDLTGHDILMEPELRVRSWTMPYGVVYGPASWSVDEQRTLLRQLAKLKFNRLTVSVEPWQPFVEYQFGGVRKETARLFRHDSFRVDGDTVGKKAFLGAEVFANPDLAGAATPQELTDAGVRLLRGVIAAAREVGLSVGLSISPLAFPREFQAVLPGSRIGSDQLTIVARTNPTDETLRKLVAAKVAAYVATYPEIDRLCLRLPEAPNSDVIAPLAASQPRISAQRADVVEMQAGQLTFLSQLIANQSLMNRSDGKQVDLIVTGFGRDLWPVLDQALPPGTEVIVASGDSASELAEHVKLLGKVPAKRWDNQLLIRLADDHAGVLPQAAPQSTGKSVTALSELGWQGYITGCAMTGDLDPTVFYLSRAAWAGDLTPHEVQVELWTTMTGNQPAAERLWLGWDHLEQATNLIGHNGRFFAAPAPGMLMKHYVPKPIPDWWQAAIDHYTEYMTELYRARGSIDGDAKPVLFYHAKRSEHVLEYMNAVKAIREAALAKADGDTDAALEHLETALEQTYNSINTLADVSRYQSDRGLIALLNEYAYRPLLAEYEKLADGE